MHITLFAVALVTAATYGLSPVNAAPPQEPEERGRASTAGVSLSVKADSWVGWPAPLTEVIPLLVTVHNGSSMPVRIRYQEFQLVPPSGAARSALPPFDIRGAETTAVGTVGIVPGPYPYVIDGFLVAPYMSAFYPHLTPFAGPFLFDPVFYSTNYPVFLDIPLPTRDMVAKALPEGVLQPGGSITGYIYFQGDDVAGERATLRMDVVDASNGRMLGSARIPLEID